VTNADLLNLLKTAIKIQQKMIACRGNCNLYRISEEEKLNRPFTMDNKHSRMAI